MVKRKRILLALVVLVVLSSTTVAWIFQNDNVRWRVRVATLKLTGRVPELAWSELLTMMRQRGGYGLEGLLEGKSVHVTLRNPYITETDIVRGGELFNSRCAGCHGATGEGGTGPRLTGGSFKHGNSDLALFRTITRGIPGTAMNGFDLQDSDAWRAVSFVRSIQLQDPRHPSPLAPDTFHPVAAEALEREDVEAEWLMYSGAYNGNRHSQLRSINSETVANLRLKWVYQFEAGSEPVEATPIVVGGVIYVTDHPNKVIALDASDGRLLWTYSRELPAKLAVDDVPSNRGVAVYGERVYVGTLDAHLVALKASTGQVIWDVEVGRPEDGHSITSAPLVVKGKVVIGVAGGEFGIRGFIDAYDADSGRRAWRFYTVPSAGQPGSETWQGDSWRTGGGSTWLTGSFDPRLNLIYWGVGNPAPNFNGDARQGDNLYTSSVVALDADTGILRWHFQFTPHDLHDWDSNQIPVLADLMIEGRARKVLLWANRNGFYYVLDRQTGQYVTGRPFVKVSWAKGLTESGRPIVVDDIRPTEAGSLAWPSVIGGTNWWSPSYSPSTGLFYVGAIERAALFFKEATTWRRGQFFTGGTSLGVAQPETFVRALKAETGELSWEYRFEADLRPTLSGVLSTAGNVLFAGGSGPKGLFVALNATTGQELWRSRLGGLIHSGPITFLNDGKQLIAVTAGHTLYVFDGGPAELSPRS